MKINELIGKLAIRTKPIELGKDIFGKRNYDYSYTTDPIKILKVTDNHILYSYKGTRNENIFSNDLYILDERWIDDNWIDYKELTTIK